MKNRAFTLLELLVVITIIGILSSIVIVSMSGSTDSATIAKGKAYAQQMHALLGHEAVLDLNFNEGGYGTCPDGADVCDASGYNNNGEIYDNEAVYVSSPIDGYALSFDGSNDYIDILNTLTFTDEITVEAWIKPYDVTKLWQGIIKRGKWRLALGSSNKPYFEIVIGSSNYGWYAPSAMSNNKWYHLIGVYNGSRIYCYINGITSNGLSRTGNIDTDTANIRVGFHTSYYIGLIDEVRIYSEALPSTEVQKRYVQGLERLLANQAIIQAEYDQRMEELNHYLVSNP
jgi:prepilin-type N-terminal cleavage/methylation domain-containing protein